MSGGKMIAACPECNRNLCSVCRTGCAGALFSFLAVQALVAGGTLAVLYAIDEADRRFDRVERVLNIEEEKKAE